MGRSTKERGGERNGRCVISGAFVAAVQHAGAEETVQDAHVRFCMEKSSRNVRGEATTSSREFFSFFFYSEIAQRSGSVVSVARRLLVRFVLMG